MYKEANSCIERPVNGRIYESRIYMYDADVMGSTRRGITIKLLHPF